MPSTYSPNLRIELIATGEQSGTWGITTNTNLGTLIEDAVAGYVSVSITSANQALTALNGAADQSRNMVINLTTTTTANFNVYIPPADKVYIIRNSSAYQATIFCSTVLGNTTAAGTGTAIPAGRETIVFSDGTNVNFGLDYASTLALGTALPATSGGTDQSSYAVGDILFASTTTALSKLADVATGNALISGGVGVAPAYGKIGLTTHVSGTLPVANGGTGITSLGTGVATWLGTPSSANLAAAVTDETGTGALVFATAPLLSAPTFSTSATVTAGTNAQGQGAITSDFNVITTTAANPSGVTLPTATTGRKVIIVNKGTNPVNVYPATGAAIDALAANAAISLPVGELLEFNASSTTQWYSTINSATSVDALIGTVAATQGGTGQSSYAIGDLLFASTTTALSKLADVATGNALISGGVGVAPSYGKIGLTTHVSGTLPVANGGSGTTTAQGAMNAFAGAVTSGQYLRGNGTNVVMSTIQAADVPTLNQNTTGTAAGLSATLVATSGGTGQSSYAVGDLLFASTTTALSKLADVATGNALISGGVGVAPSYGKIGLTTHVSGTLPVANGGTGITSFGTGVATWLGTPSSANLAAAVTDETGSGALVFATSPTLVTPALGTPASGVVTNLTGTASININGTVGATTANTGAFTTLSASGDVNFTGTGAVQLPAGTTAQRPTPVTADLRYNTSFGRPEVYNGSAWVGLGGATGGGGDNVFYENSQTVTTNYTITSGDSAMSTGPITINSSVTVTIPSGSRWVIL
jgi:hypothetical protein